MGTLVVGDRVNHGLVEVGAAGRSSPAARGWFIRCTTTAHWYEGETDTNRNDALLDYYRWAADAGEDQLAENLLVGLASDGFKRTRISVVSLEQGSYKSYRDDWRDTNADVDVWHEATVELARLRARSHNGVEANRLLRFASETKARAGSRQLSADEVMLTLPSNGSVRTLLTQALQSAWPGQLAGQIAGLQAGAIPDSDGSGSRASYGLLDWLVREYLPEWLDAGMAYGLASWLRGQLPQIVDAETAYAASSLIYDASQSGDRAHPTCLRPPDGASGFDALTSSWEDVRLASISAGAFRSVMRAIGGDVATDLAEGAGVPDADIAASRRFLSSTNLWLAMWAATVDDQTVKAFARDRHEARAHPWLELWDLASRKAWESAQVASHNILLQARVGADIFDPAMVLDRSFAPTRTALQLSVFESFTRIALDA